MTVPLVEVVRNGQPLTWIFIPPGQVVTIAVNQTVVLSIFDDGTTKPAPDGGTPIRGRQSDTPSNTKRARKRRDRST